MHLTVYFDGQFWIGLVQQQDEGRLRVTRHVFGAEPSNIEVLQFVLRDSLSVLACATAAVSIDDAINPITNPKRAAREAAKVIRQPVVSTKAQIALKLQHKQHQQDRQQSSKAEREAESVRKREIARQKAKQRHRGH